MAIHLPQKKRVLSNEKYGSAGRILKIDIQLDFIPGQLVSISQTLTGPSRLYSICSAPGNVSLDIIYNLVEEGNLTPGLWQLKPGDDVLFQGPRGGFVEPINGEEKRIWWIANGTGVSPFISLLRHFKNTQNPAPNRRHLIFGCRTPFDAWFLEELIVLVKNYGLHCILCLSSPDASSLVSQHPIATTLPIWTDSSTKGNSGGLFLYFGRLTSWSGLNFIPQNDLAMLCGSSLMISDVRDRLIASNMNVGNIFAETYF